MKRTSLTLITSMLFGLTLVVIAGVAQQDSPKAAPPQMDQDRFEAVHEQLYDSKDKARDTSRLTQTLSPSLPPSEAAYAPVPRKNFVDELVFGRMERDHIPHAALASDPEFLRRAYLDATGLLPTVEQARKFLADSSP